MVGWCHWLCGHEFEQAQGANEEQGSLGCCSPWGHRESDTTWQPNSSNNQTKLNWVQKVKMIPTTLLTPVNGTRMLQSHTLIHKPGSSSASPSSRFLGPVLRPRVAHRDLTYHNSILTATPLQINRQLNKKTCLPAEESFFLVSFTYFLYFLN